MLLSVSTYVQVCLVMLIIFGCKTPGSSGKVIQGKDGVNQGGVVKLRCTPPEKSYSKEIKVRLNAEMDSLKFTPVQGFEAAVEQKVVKLRDWSKDGLDWDYFNFRLCEMANNRGLTNEQTTRLLEKSMELWFNRNATTLQQNITSYGQTGGITAGNVFMNKPRRVFDLNAQKQMHQFFAMKDVDSVNIEALMGNYEAGLLGIEIEKYMTTNGKKAVFFNAVMGPFEGVYIDTTYLSANRFVTIKIGENDYK